MPRYGYLAPALVAALLTGIPLAPRAGTSVALTLKVKQGKTALKRAKPTITISAQRGTLRPRAVKRSLKLA